MTISTENTTSTYKHCFLPYYKELQHIQTSQQYSKHAILQEPELNHIELKKAQPQAGTITRYLISLIPEQIHAEANAFQEDILITVKTGKAKKESQVLTPSWHAKGDTDDDEEPNPNLTRIAETKHLICMLSVSRIGILQKEILTTPISIPVEPKRVWESVNEELARAFRPLYRGNKPATTVIGENKLYMIGGNTLHRALPALDAGAWYYFKATLVNRHR